MNYSKKNSLAINCNKEFAVLAAEKLEKGQFSYGKSAILIFGYFKVTLLYLILKQP